MKKAFFVVGAGYGDEGKGLMTDYLCHTHNADMVVRYNGGAQAGHTVVTPEGERHVFSHFGSGTFLGVPTYLDSTFIVNPILFNMEYDKLRKYAPNVYVNRVARVTVPYDMLFNHVREYRNKHGSCGIGIYDTINRSVAGGFAITVDDLRNESIFYFKELLREIRDNYVTLAKRLDVPKELLDAFDLDVDYAFAVSCHDFLNRVEVANSLFDVPHTTAVYEGAQGLLLTEDYGTAPYLTPSSPSAKFIRSRGYGSMYDSVECCFVTRAYATRHGNGPLANEIVNDDYASISLTPNPNETNQYNQYQGKFRYGALDVQTLARVIEGETENADMKYSLAVTCLDQLSVDKQKEVLYNIENSVWKPDYLSYGPTRNDVRKV